MTPFGARVRSLREKNNIQLQQMARELARDKFAADAFAPEMHDEYPWEYGKILAEGANRVVAENDPTWHGEIEAIRKACKAQGSFKLRNATLYTSAEPCPMCMAAAYWAGVKNVYYAAQVEDALEYGGFDDSMIYAELKKDVGERSIPTQQIMREEAVEVWKKYAQKADRVPY